MKSSEFNAITPYIVVSNAREAIDLYIKGLGATEISRLLSPDGKAVVNACLDLRGSRFFLSDESPEMGMLAPKAEVGSRFYLYVDDVDASHAKALAAGMTEHAAPEDMFWGDRTSVIIDKFGHRWTFAKQFKDVSVEEITEAMKAMAG